MWQEAIPPSECGTSRGKGSCEHKTKQVYYALFDPLELVPLIGAQWNLISDSWWIKTTVWEWGENMLGLSYDFIDCRKGLRCWFGLLLLLYLVFLFQSTSM